MFKPGDTHEIQPYGFDSRISERYCKDGKVLFGRENNDIALDFPFSNQNKYLARQQLEIVYDGFFETYFMKDVSKQMPTYIQI